MRHLLVLALAGCGQIFGLASPSHAPDAAADSMPDTPVSSCEQRWLDGTVVLDPPVASATQSATRDATLSRDELELYASQNNLLMNNYAVVRATRASPTAMFGQLAEVAELTSGSYDGRVTVSSGGTFLVMASDRTGGAGGVDLWTSTRPDVNSPWTTPTRGMVAGLDDAGDQLDPELSADGLHLYYSQKTTASAQALMMSPRGSTSDPFGQGAPITELESGTDADPAVSRDERIIVFSSTRTGSQSVDLWYAVRDSSGTFGAPRLVPAVNGNANEGDPYLTNDACTLMFASDRSGMFQLYVAAVR